LSQVQTFLEMDSHEEKIQEIIERNKELEATEERKRRAKEIQRKELARRNLELLPTSGAGNSRAGGYDSYQSSQNNQSYQPTYQPTPVIEMNSNQASNALGSKPSHSRGGLQLGKKPTKVVPEAHQSLLSHTQPVFNHPKPQHLQPEATPPISQSASPIPANPKVPNNGILITVNEKVTAELTREGSILSSEVKGDLQLRINSAELAHSKILLKKSANASGIDYKTHPNVDRNLFKTDSIIGLKDQSKSFPSNDQALGVLRWRAVGKQDDSSLVPLVITAWVSVNDSGVAEVTLEYELTSDFVDAHSSSGHPSIENIQILVPIASPDVDLKDHNDSISYEISDIGVIFNIASVSVEEPQGSFEFTIPASDEDALFPLELRIELSSTEVTESDISLGHLQVIDVVSNNEDEKSLPFDLHYNLISDNYQVN